MIEKRFGIFTNCYMNMGNLWAQRKDYQKAIEHYEKVIELSPHRAPK
jgi:tetratricopeptide (TPR) repeat protein